MSSTLKPYWSTSTSRLSWMPDHAMRGWRLHEESKGKCFRSCPAIAPEKTSWLGLSPGTLSFFGGTSKIIPQTTAQMKLWLYHFARICPCPKKKTEPRHLLHVVDIIDASTQLGSGAPVADRKQNQTLRFRWPFWCSKNSGPATYDMYKHISIQYHICILLKWIQMV